MYGGVNRSSLICHQNSNRSHGSCYSPRLFWRALSASGSGVKPSALWSRNGVARAHAHAHNGKRESGRGGERENTAQQLKIQIIGTGWRVLEIITHKHQQSNIFLQWDKRDSSPIIEISPISSSTLSVKALVTVGEFP